MNRTREVKMACQAAGITKYEIYIAGPRCDMNTTGDVEYNVRFDNGTIEQRLRACEYAKRFIDGVVDARLTRTYKSGGREYGRRIKICFGDRADGSSLDDAHPLTLANAARRRIAAARAGLI
jgi:hypothetical protein